MRSQLEKSGRAIEQEEKKKKSKGKRRIGENRTKAGREEVQERTDKTKSASLATLEPR